MTVGLTIYMLMWPVIVAATMIIIARGFYKDWREARREGRPLI